jgi:hypothetical protein
LKENGGFVTWGVVVPKVVRVVINCKVVYRVTRVDGGAGQGPVMVLKSGGLDKLLLNN